MKTARAVKPNKGVECWYRKRLQAMLCACATDGLRSVRAVYDRHESSMLHAQDAVDRSVQLRIVLSKWGKRWDKRLNKLSVNIAAAFAAKAQRATQIGMKASFRDAGLTVRFKPTRASKEAYRAVAAEQVNLIRSIPTKFATDVESAVWTSVMRGADMNTLSKQIRKRYGVATRRAALIARDQNNKAKAVIENVRRMELGFNEAIWQHSGAGKEPRPDHVAFNGKRYSLKTGAPVEGQYPGMAINCRCTSRVVLD